MTFTSRTLIVQVRALEKEMMARAAVAGVPDIQPRIIVLTRLIPDARGTSCDEPYEPISGTEHAAIVRIPFHDSQCAPQTPWTQTLRITLAPTLTVTAIVTLTLTPTLTLTLTPTLTLTLP